MVKKLLSSLALSYALFSAAFVCQGALSVKFGSAMEVIEGGVTNTYAANATFTPTAVPCIYMMRPVLAAGERTFCVDGSDDCYRFPMYGEGNWVRVALSGDTQVTLTGRKVSNIYYADDAHGDDDWDGTADYEHRDESATPKRGPKKTLQAAHDVAVVNTAVGYPLVLVAPGVYDEGETNTYGSGTSNLCKRRLYADKGIGFVATGGPEKTFIVGAPDPTTGGLGANAVGGVLFKADDRAFLQGFTITGCYSPATQSANNQYGAAFCGLSRRAYALDCVISNNVADTYSAIRSGTIMRTRIFENTASRYLFQYGYFVSCVFAGNRITYGAGSTASESLGSGGTFRFCTVDLMNGEPPSGRGRLQSDTQLYGVLAYGLTDKSTVNETYWHYSVACDSPMFANPSTHDYRLGLLSPAMDVMVYSGVDDDSRRWLTADVDGRLPILHDGKMPYGAVWRNEPEVRYVDCENGDDANSGTSVSQAKRTIHAAMAEAVGGDTVRVAPGVYGAQEGRQSVGSCGYSRVVANGGVTLESTDGAERTFIVGAAATGDQIDNAEYGTGTNAVRCVYAKSGATVRGFTLTGGRGVGAGSGLGVDSGVGTAFYSESPREATVEDCIVSNNAAYRGAIFEAIVRRCRVVGNVGLRSDNACGPAGYRCSWYGTVVDKNVGHGTVHNAYWIENCTVGADNLDLDGRETAALYWYVGQPRAIVNSAVLSSRYNIGGGCELYCTNCIVMSGISGDKPNAELAHNTIFTNAAAAELDSEYRPILGSFAGIDMGDAACSSDTLGDADVYGTPRILNGALDIGAVEYDWRPVFARELGRRFSMAYASPSVTTNAAGGLIVFGGEIVGALNQEGSYEISFSLTGGTLTVCVGERVVGESSGAGEGKMRFRISSVDDKVRFVFTPGVEGSDAAILARLALMRGFVLMCR